MEMGFPFQRFPLRPPGRRAASLVGTLRPGRRGHNRAVAGSLGHSRSEAKAIAWCAPSLIAASGRRTRRPGSQRYRKTHVSPDPEAFHARTLEIALVCTARERTIVWLSLAPISRAATRGQPFLVTLKGGRVVPRGTAEGRGGFPGGTSA